MAIILIVLVANKTHIATPSAISFATQTKTQIVIIPSEFTDEKGISMLLVQEGEFTMGSIDGNVDERPVHTVY